MGHYRMNHLLHTYECVSNVKVWFRPAGVPKGLQKIHFWAHRPPGYRPRVVVFLLRLSPCLRPYWDSLHGIKL